MRLLILSIILLTGCGGAESKKVSILTVEVKGVELVSHRGINSDDNTIDGFYNAINLGFDSVETDLRMHNGVVVLAHDKTLDGYPYATLDDFLLFASNNNVKIWIEAKETETIRPTLDKLNHYSLTVNFSSHKQSDLDLIKSINPLMETGRIITRKSQIESIDADWAIIQYSFIEDNYDKIKHLKIAAWTFRKQEEYDTIKHLIDAAISDIELIK